MAAEMSTGVLCMGHLYKKSPKVSMLVQKIEGSFYKKATGTVTFTTEDGGRIESMIRQAMASGKSTCVNAHTMGKDKAGNTIASFIITWTFKIKTTKI